MGAIPDNKFRPVVKARPEKDAGFSPEPEYWKDAWNRLKKNKSAIAGLLILVAVFLLAVVAPAFSPYDHETQNYHSVNTGPSAAHWFGTDDFGRDLWVRVWLGTRISLFIGLMAAVINLLVGTGYGGISAYFGGRVDEAMQRVSEVVYAIPFLLLTVWLIMAIGPGIWAIILAYSVAEWMMMARLVRGEVLSLKEREFVLAARTLGASPWRIMIRHLLPNTLPVVIVYTTFVVPQAIFVEAFLSFVGLGIRPPLASLGTLMAEGVQAMRLYPYQVMFPTLVFSLILFGFNMLGDGLRDAFDPKLRK